MTDYIQGNENLNFETYTYTDHGAQDIENGIDPKNKIYINILNECKDYIEDQFLKRNTNTEGTLSIIHFSSRTLKLNVPKIKQCLRQFGKNF